MHLIVGLGNPGPQYQKTRHNLGFLTLQALARRHQLSIEKRKFNGRYGVGEIIGHRVILLTPSTYMNRSGLSVSSFLRYYQVDSNKLIVIHDELDLPWSRMRISIKGGGAGHKGILSIIEHLQTRDFIRIRLGIGHPPEKISGETYVLETLSTTERQELPHLLTKACESVEMILEQGVVPAMNRFNIRESKSESEGMD